LQGIEGKHELRHADTVDKSAPVVEAVPLKKKMLFRLF